MNENSTSMFSKMVIEDPLADLPAEWKPQCVAIRLGIMSDAKPSNSQPWSDTHGIVLAVEFGNDNESRVWGTAVMVGPGIALSAKHVFDARPELTSASEWCCCLSVIDGELHVWQVSTITPVGDTDLVILGLCLRTPIVPGLKFPQAVMSARVPLPGEMLRISGFTSTHELVETDRSRDSEPMDLSLCYRQGRVLQQLVPRRDRVAMTWPAVEVDSGAAGGMSGGAVFDCNGVLVGILSKEMVMADGSGPCYGALLYPALIASFYGGWPARRFPDRRMLLDEQACVIEHREAFTIDRTATMQSTVRCEFRYAIPLSDAAYRWPGRR